MYLDAFSLTGGTGTPPSNHPPTAAFTVAPTSPQIGQTVTFTDGSSDPDGTIAARAWDLDNDGQYNDATGADGDRDLPERGHLHRAPAGDRRRRAPSARRAAR